MCVRGVAAVVQMLFRDVQVITSFFFSESVYVCGGDWRERGSPL